MLQKILQKIGLSEKESHVYLMSLRLGIQPISVIAERVGIQRTTAYSIVNSLIKKGLATKVEKRGIVVFSVTAPKNLISYLEREKNEYTRAIERNKEDLQDLLPYFTSLEIQNTTKPKVRFFEGEKGMREAYEETLNSSEVIRAYANVEEMHRALPNFFPEYYLRRKEAGISIRAIFPNNQISTERARHDSRESRETRLIDHKRFSFSPELNIYDNKVLIASWCEKMAVVIESQEVAELHKKIFDLLWEKLSTKSHGKDSPN
jgi:sugar-specific transcriptional regulator TrmB